MNSDVLWIRDDDVNPPRKWWQRRDWSPFDKCGNIRLVMVTDPWWMKLWAKIRGDGAWTKMGALRDPE